MGVGGKFWDLLKPYARHEGPDYLREKRVAVDLSYWIVQHETAIKATHVRKPHLRLTFFRTIILFSKFGALPVFVVDGTPSPLKSRARIARFFRFSGVDVSGLLVAEGVSSERNKTFLKCVQECVELLELFGMPVLKANGEAEALCAQLNAEGHVDACITADSDAFLFGAKCVIKCVKPNAKEPFECYHISDVEDCLDLKRKHLIAISLLVGNDHDLNGVQGIGLEKALRFVRSFSEDEILNQLHEIANGNSPSLQIVSKVVDEIMLCPAESPAMSKTSHCSLCGHPGSKRAHFKSSCEYCGTSTSQGCTRKGEGFKCNCSSCNKGRKEKEQQKHENWHVKVCNKISAEPNFPNDDIIQMYLCNKHGNFTAGDGLCLSWRCPDIDILVDFMDFHQHWEPSYVRQRMLPMLSTIYLREMAAKPEKSMLYGQYVFDSIQRVKIRYGHQSYVIRWRKMTSTAGSIIRTNSAEESDKPQEEIVEIDEFNDHLDEDTAPQIHIDDGCCFLLTDENMELIRGAFPEEVERFLHEKELKASKRRKGSGFKNEGSDEKSESPKSKRVQLKLTEFYQSAKVAAIHTKQGDLANNSENQEDGPSKEKKKVSGVRILVVESDPTCLRIVSKMLQVFGYEVKTATRATDAMHILREKEDEINLILTETHLPDMDQYEILETVGELSSSPIVVFSADNNESTILGCLFKGAELYLVKPVIKNDVKNLWQLTYRTKLKTAVSGEGSNTFHGGSAEQNTSSLTVGNPASTMGMTDQKGKRKELEETDNDHEYIDNLTAPKKSKLVWTNELHNIFLQALRIVGVDGAHPKKILQHMNVPGLKKENVSSHLQKYRLYLKREQDGMQKTMVGDCRPSSTFNPQGGFSQYTNSQFFMTASQSEYRNNFQNNLCSPMSVHSLGFVHSPTHVNSNYNGILIPNYVQVDSQSKQLYPSYPNSNHTEIITTTDGSFSSFDQKGKYSVDEHLNQGTTLSNTGTHGPTFLGNSQQQVQFPLPQPQPLPEKEDESEILDIATMEELELLAMEKEFLEDLKNDLWL